MAVRERDSQFGYPAAPMLAAHCRNPVTFMTSRTNADEDQRVASSMTEGCRLASKFMLTNPILFLGSRGLLGLALDWSGTGLSPAKHRKKSDVSAL